MWQSGHNITCLSAFLQMYEISDKSCKSLAHGWINTMWCDQPEWVGARKSGFSDTADESKFSICISEQN